MTKSWSWSWLERFFRCVALLFLLIALARPQADPVEEKKSYKALDIILAIDVSESMKQPDFIIGRQRVDRLTALKAVLKQFIDSRTEDRIGTVVFGEKAFPQAPLTMDHGTLFEFLRMSEAGMAGRRTAIGDAIAVSANQLRSLSTQTKIIILLTDGDNNSGKIQPLEAAKAASAYDVRIYTIGMGPKRYIDEPLLKKIAAETRGRYFHAADTETLSQVYKNIDKLEKTEIDSIQWDVREEKFMNWVFLSFFFLCCEIIFLLTPMRRLP